MSAEIYVSSAEPSALSRIVPILERYGGPSRIWPRAQELIEEGADGLRLVGRRLDAVDPFSPSERTAFLNRNEVVRRNLALNQASIVAGVTLHAIEDVLITGAFSETDFVRNYHSAVDNSKLSLDLWAQTMETVLIDPDRNSRLLELARSDRTLAVFFSASSQDALPDGLKRLLNESGTLDRIRLQIAPAYRERFRIRE